MKQNDENLPDPWTVLREDAEPMPKWLASYKPGDPFPRRDFFNSRIVYYPGSRTDGHPLRIFGKAHTAHCFVYCDNSLSAEGVEDQLEHVQHPGHPTGYKKLAGLIVPENELTPIGWTPHPHIKAMVRDASYPDFATSEPNGGSFAYWAVLERTDDFGEDHGPKRISILHIGGEGIATFDAFFCQKEFTLPYAILLHDHGCGGSWAKFGGEVSPLWKLASEQGGQLPRWLLVAHNTKPWPGYVKVSSPDGGGMYKANRCLFRLK